MSTQVEAPTVNSKLLRWLADSYEQSQRLRIETGERIRAVLQGRDETWDVEIEPDVDAEEVLKAIKRHETSGPVPILGATYRRHWEMEREFYTEMMSAVVGHPAWSWLERVKGIGPTLACKMLARLDLGKAATPSSFWAYCGLTTVPGNLYRCPTCNAEAIYASTYEVSGKHKTVEGKACKDSLLLIAGPDDGIRAALPRASRGSKRSYDAYAKKVLYLIAMQFIKARNSPYTELYYRERNRLDRERPGWHDGRKHYTALRKVEKLFLSHLWQVWREALGLPIVMPYAIAHMGHDDGSWISAWDMVEANAEE
jgi:hypothetical protein